MRSIFLAVVVTTFPGPSSVFEARGKRESGALVKAFSGKIGIEEIDAAVQASRRAN